MTVIYHHLSYESKDQLRPQENLWNTHGWSSFMWTTMWKEKDSSKLWLHWETLFDIVDCSFCKAETQFLAEVSADCSRSSLAAVDAEVVVSLLIELSLFTSAVFVPC